MGLCIQQIHETHDTCVRRTFILNTKMYTLIFLNKLLSIQDVSNKMICLSVWEWWCIRLHESLSFRGAGVFTSSTLQAIEEGNSLLRILCSAERPKLFSNKIIGKFHQGKKLTDTESESSASPHMFQFVNKESVTYTRARSSSKRWR